MTTTPDLNPMSLLRVFEEIRRVAGDIVPVDATGWDKIAHIERLTFRLHDRLVKASRDRRQEAVSVTGTLSERLLAFAHHLDTIRFGVMEPDRPFILVPDGEYAEQRYDALVADIRAAAQRLK